MKLRPVPFGTSNFKDSVAIPSQRSGGTHALSPRFGAEAPDVYETDASPKEVPVKVWVKQYETGTPVKNAKVIDLATGDSWKTGKDGYAHLSVAPGRTLTLALHKALCPDIQTASVTVPPEGLTDLNNEITIQAAGSFLYKLLRLGIGKPEADARHIIVTVSAAGKNLHDDEGEAGVKLTLRTADGQPVENSAMYLGKLLGKTEWFRPVLSARIPFLKRFAKQETSGDGGVVFRNVKPEFKNGQPAEYVIEASKTGPDGKPMTFSSAKVRIYPDSPEVINVSPPLGPRVIG